jgi:hypothetical protein
VTDLLEAKLDRFDKLKQKKPEIDAALTDSSATFVLVIGYTGEQQMSPDALRPIEEFLEEQNDPTELISFKQLRQADLHAIVARQAIGESVKLTVLLHEQDRLKTEMFLECGKIYAYKTGDHSPLADEGCTFDDAVVALACAHEDSGLCVQAKREVGLLYDDITQAPYRKLFNGSVSALKVWRSVEVMRAVGETLREQANLEGPDRLIAVHGNRFILHLVFRILDKYESAAQSDFDAMKKRIPEITVKMLTEATAEKEKQAKGSYPANVFKNATKCKGLADAILRISTKKAGKRSVRVLSPGT